MLRILCPFPGGVLRLLLAVVVLLSAVPVWAEPLDGGKKSFTLVIDAGHGGHDAGAVGKVGKEKNINLKVALALGRLIEANCPEVKVVYTRRTDVFVALDRRADIANNAKADLFVSIHTNALPKGQIARGTETYTLGTARAAANLEVAKRENSVIVYEKDYRQRYAGFDPNKAESYIIFELMQDRYMTQSIELARAVQQQYTRAGRQNKGVHQAGFLVLRNTSMPAILTELGFISTPDEERYLLSDRGVSELALSLYNGIAAYRRKHTNARPADLPALPADDASAEPAPRPSTPSTPSKSDAAPADSGSRPDRPADRPAPQRQSRPEHTQPDHSEDDSERPIFRIQLFVADRQLKKSDARFKGLSPVDFYREGGMYKYTYGSTPDYNEIKRLRTTIAKKFPNAFIVAFAGGKRVNLSDAIRQSRSKR